MKRILFSILILMLISFNVFAQEDIFARQIKVKGRGAKIDGSGNIPLYWNGFYEGTYSGSAHDAFSIDYTGAGHLIFNWQSNGQPRFTMNKPGRAILTGHLRFSGSSRYINFGDYWGDGGYGIRDNAGILQVKDSGGVWASISGGGIVQGDIVAGDGLTGGADNVLPGPDADVRLDADANLLVFGFPFQIDVTDDGDGKVILSLPQNIDTGATPAFSSVHLSNLTASRLVSSDGSQVLESTDISAWIAGTANDVTVGDDLDGSVTLSTVNLGNIVAGTGLTGGADDVLPGAEADVTINADANLLVAGTADDVTVTDDLDGTITLSTISLGDITTSGTGMSGGADDVLPGADTDVTITLDTSKDLVAGTGLTGGEDDVFPGAEADVTINADANLLVAGTANRVTVTDDLDGTITLTSPQDTHTTATPQFAGLGVGKVSPAAGTHIFGVGNDEPLSSVGNFAYIIDSRNYDATYPGGILLLGGEYDSSANITPFAGIRAAKDNTGDGDKGGGMRFYTRKNGVDVWQNNERMTITSTGRLAIGPGNILADSLVEIEEDSSNTTVTIGAYHDDEATSPKLTLRKADNTQASPQPVDTGAILGTIEFDGRDDNGFDTGATIYAKADADWSSSERGTDLFFQSRDGAGDLTDQFTVTADGNFRGVTSKWHYCKYIDMFSVSPGASGPDQIVMSSVTIGGYNLDVITEYLYFNGKVCTNWDASSDLWVIVTYEVDVDNTGGLITDTVDFSLLCYYKGSLEIVNKTQTATCSEVVGQSPRYKQFQDTLVIDYDPGGGNDVDIGDVFAFRLNLDTGASEVDSVVVNIAIFTYQTALPQIEL